MCRDILFWILQNTYFKKEEEHSITCRSGGSSQIDSILCRRRNSNEFSNCKIVPGESVMHMDVHHVRMVKDAEGNIIDVRRTY